jgi:cellobiose-specific phosphotransferase system component IIA
LKKGDAFKKELKKLHSAGDKKLEQAKKKAEAAEKELEAACNKVMSSLRSE